MGIGGGIFLIAIGAILTFAVNARISWLDLTVVGWVLMLAGAAVLGLTIYFWQTRRRKRGLSLVEQAQLAHDPVHSHPTVPPPPDAELPPTP
jgi:uncharacterized membrane protein YbhN (UPF0104 family)